MQPDYQRSAIPLKLIILIKTGTLKAKIDRLLGSQSMFEFLENWDFSQF